MSAFSVNCEKMEINPRCPHGPTAKFTRKVKGKSVVFFACSAYRDRKLCNFYHSEEDVITVNQQIKWSTIYENSLPKAKHSESYALLSKIKKLDDSVRHFCDTCGIFVLPKNLALHKRHKIISDITNEMLRYPTNLLIPITNNKKEAQYWFNNSTKEFIINSFKALEVKAVLCIGTPTIFESLKDEVPSLLLDIDHRFCSFFSESEFCWFNMCNFHFLSNSSCYEQVLDDFCSTTDKVGVIIDPPYGVRFEFLTRTLKALRTKMRVKCIEFLIAPYFMDREITKLMPHLEMSDYRVEYSNHNKFNNNSTAVRIFSNGLLDMSGIDGYRLCEKCNRWRSNDNRHCDQCKTCTSKSGGVYKHCESCDKCVKNSWIHCVKCGHCVHAKHECQELQVEGKKMSTKPTSKSKAKKRKQMS